MKQKIAILFSLFFLGGVVILTAQKPKLIVTTDLGQDPDDMQSTIRLLHYANEFQLLGLVANGDSNMESEFPEVRTDLLLQLIAAYDSILPNFRKVDSTYPSANYLRSIVKAGVSGNSRKKPVNAYVGNGKNTEGSDWIIKQVDENEAPIHISVWGGAEIWLRPCLM